MIQNMFTKAKIPHRLPKEMQAFAQELKKSATKRDCLKKTYSFLSKRYRGYRVYTYLRFFDLFHFDIDKVWAKRGFLHCNNLNYLMRILLVKSEMFNEEDIALKWTLIWYVSPHQYLNVKISPDKSVNVDLWGKSYGIPFGDYAHGFH